MENAFMLWYMAETDLLNNDYPYRLMNNGQGLCILNTYILLVTF